MTLDKLNAKKQDILRQNDIYFLYLSGPVKIIEF